MDLDRMTDLATIAVTGGFTALAAIGSAAYKLLTSRFDTLDKKIERNAEELAACEARHDECERQQAEVRVKLAAVETAVQYLQRDKPKTPQDESPNE